jgi:hypothetical protein
MLTQRRLRGSDNDQQEGSRCEEGQMPGVLKLRHGLSYQSKTRQTDNRGRSSQIR